MATYDTKEFPAASNLPKKLSHYPDGFTKTGFISCPLGLQADRLNIYMNFIESVDASRYYKWSRYAIIKLTSATTKQRPINQKA